MNALELADALDWVCENHLVGIGDADFKATATMLRQQQAEIEELKQIIDANNLNQNIGQFVKPTNEPVAWFEQDPNMKSIWYQSDQDNPNAIPLYTHPVKELTDEEIMEICIGFGMYDCINDPYIKKDGTYSIDEDLIRFARAILRKAQE